MTIIPRRFKDPCQIALGLAAGLAIACLELLLAFDIELSRLVVQGPRVKIEPLCCRWFRREILARVEEE